MILKKILLVTLLCGIFSNLSAKNVIEVTKISSSELLIKIDSTVHQDYGAKYPVTYVFEISHVSQEISVSKKTNKNDSWSFLPQKEVEDFYNGIELFRIDREKKQLLVSVGFGDNSDKIYLQINSGSKETEVRYIGISKYYDNRKAVVTASLDDYAFYFDDETIEACEKFREYKLWISVGIITDQCFRGDAWNKFQKLLDGGYVEAASHSRNHPRINDYDFDWEIGGSKQDIISELKLPELFRKGDKEYVYTWISPFGEHNAISDSLYGIYKYLVNRLYTNDTFGIAKWDSSKILFEPFGTSGEIGYTSWESSATKDLAVLNDRFYKAYNDDGVYHVVLHPQNINWSENYAHEHLDLISGRKDVWYAPIGHLYLYQFLRVGKI